MVVSRWPLLVQFETHAIQKLDEIGSHDITRSEHVRIALEQYMDRLQQAPIPEQPPDD